MVNPIVPKECREKIKEMTDSYSGKNLEKIAQSLRNIVLFQQRSFEHYFSIYVSALNKLNENTAKQNAV